MNWKSVLKKMLFPPFWILLPLILFCTWALVTIFTKGLESHPFAYISYVLSFYTLTAFCADCSKVFPLWYRTIQEHLFQYKNIRRYLTDAVFRTHINLYFSLIFNLLYAGIYAVAAYLFQTQWFTIFAVYYALLGILRFLLARYARTVHIGADRCGELRRSRLCAVLLLMVNVILSAVVLMMLIYGRGFQYQGLLIYPMALYTFYITTLSIVNLIRFRKYQSPVMSVSKVINLTTALFSMLFLETAMIAQFGGDSSELFRRITIICTSTGISVIVVTMCLYIIIRTSRELNAASKEKSSSDSENQTIDSQSDELS